MDKLRKVEFTLEQQEMSLGDYGLALEEVDKKTKETQKKRKGSFHCFGNKLVYDSENQCYKERVIGVVEEEKTGKVFHVAPKSITFKS